MRFLQITMSKGSRSGPPDPNHGALVRQRIAAEIESVEDPPGGDGWMAGGGYALFDVASKEEAIARAKATLSIMGDGVVELIEVTEMHPRRATSD
jgi:hypothetical protein